MPYVVVFTVSSVPLHRSGEVFHYTVCEQYHSGCFIDTSPSTGHT